MSTPRVTIKHPIIGDVVGKRARGTTQFLGVKYAQLKDRFASPDPVEYDGTGLEACIYGPQTVSPPSAVDLEMAIIQQSLHKPAFPGTSDLEGLNLNITVPETSGTLTESSDKLPVFVFIHGGGFASGANWWPQYDNAALVELSSEQKSPIIAININYRTGPLGFLTSPMLRISGYKPNNGLRDQRAALNWIKTYISGFGGDPNNVTVAGESAGGVSAGLLMLSEQPLAKRLIMFGGCPPLLGAVPIRTADQIALDVIRALGLEGISPHETVDELFRIPADDFWQKVPPTIQLPLVVDGDIVPDGMTFKTFKSYISAKTSCEEIMLGDSQLDASIFGFMSLLRRQNAIGDAFRTSAAKSLGKCSKAVLGEFLDHYKLSESQISNDKSDLFSILRFGSDICFFAPPIEAAANFPGKSYVFAFNEGNPWEGPFEGHATHILDVSFLFQNFNALMGDQQRQTAVQLASDVITFVNGRTPWKSFNDGQHGVAVYGGGKRIYAEPPEERLTARSPFIFDFTSRGDVGPTLDDMMHVFLNFLGGN